MLEYLQLRVALEAVENVELPPYPGSTLRGAFAWALKRSTCVTQEQCDETCQWPRSCPYGLLTETPIPTTAPGRIQASKFAPHPYVLTPPSSGGLKIAGSPLSFRLALWGPAIDQAPFVLRALDDMANQGMGRGRKRLKLVEISDLLSGQELLVDGELDFSALETGSLDLENDGRDGSHHHLKIQLETPVNLQKRGQMLEELSFDELVYYAADRLYLLTHCHGDPDDAPDAAAWARRARDADIERIEHRVSPMSFHRYSGRQQRKHRVQGLTGHAIFSGEIAPFRPLLKQASITHIGKGTSFGLGRFSLQTE